MIHKYFIKTFKFTAIYYMTKTNNMCHCQVVLGAAAVGVGVAVGAGIAYLSTRIMYSTRVTQQISHLHDNIVEMKHNLAVIEQGIVTLCSCYSRVCLKLLCPLFYYSCLLLPLLQLFLYLLLSLLLLFLYLLLPLLLDIFLVSASFSFNIILVFAYSFCFTFSIPMCEVFCVGYTPCAWDLRSLQLILNGLY